MNYIRIIYSGTAQNAELLADCYRNSLELAKEHGIHSIAFPPTLSQFHPAD